MGNIDERMAPARHFDHALRIHHGVVFRGLGIPEAEGAGLFLCHPNGFGDFLQGLGQLLGIVHIEIDAGPLLGRHAPFHQRLGLQAGLDREQAQAGGHLSVIAHLGGAHGGAACAGRHDAPAVARKKQGVDHLGLAARELGHKGHHHLVRAQLGLQAQQALFDAGIQQLVVFQPFGQQLQAQRKLTPPCAVLVKLIVE